MELGRRGFRRRVQPGRGGSTEPFGIGAETIGQHLKKGDARASLQFAVACQDLPRECYSGCFPAARQQLLAELDEVSGMLLGDTATMGAVEQGSPALRDRLQHIAKEGGGHSRPNRLCSRAPLNRSAMTSLQRCLIRAARTATGARAEHMDNVSPKGHTRLSS